jgi:hypothetical protein
LYYYRNYSPFEAAIFHLSKLMKKLLILSIFIALGALSSCKDTLPSAPKNTGTPGLVAWYKLDQNAADSSGNGHDGIMQGGIFVPDRFGSAQSALGLDGSSFVSVPNSNDISFDSSSSYTISVWIKTTATSAGIVAKGPIFGSFPGYSIGLQNGNAEVLISSIDNVDLVGNSKINDNGWHLVTLTVDSHGGVILYIDGVADVKYLSVGMFPDRDNTAPFFIGKDRLSTSLLTGSLDDIRIYSKVLSGNDILALYHEHGWNGNLDTTGNNGGGGGGGGTPPYGPNTLDNSGFTTTVSTSPSWVDAGSFPPWNVAYGAPMVGPGYGADSNGHGYLYMWGTSDDGCAVWEPLSTPIVKGHTYHIKAYMKIPSVDLHNTPYANVRFVAFNSMPSGMHWLTSPGQVASIGIVNVSKHDSWDPYTTVDWTADANYSNFEVDVSNGNSGAGFETWVGVDNIQLQQKN